MYIFQTHKNSEWTGRKRIFSAARKIRTVGAVWNPRRPSYLNSRRGRILSIRDCVWTPVWLPGKTLSNRPILIVIIVKQPKVHWLGSRAPYCAALSLSCSHKYFTCTFEIAHTFGMVRTMVISRKRSRGMDRNLLWIATFPILLSVPDVLTQRSSPVLNVLVHMLSYFFVWHLQPSGAFVTSAQVAN